MWFYFIPSHDYRHQKKLRLLFVYYPPCGNGYITKLGVSNFRHGKISKDKTVFLIYRMPQGLLHLRQSARGGQDKKALNLDKNYFC